MEWSDFEDPPFDDSFLSFLSPQLDIEQAEWTFEENKLFENALAEFDPGSPAFFENVASRVPWKSIEQIKKHYQALVEDIEMIETGRISVPNYETCEQEPQEEQLENNKEKEPITQAKKNTGQQRRRGIPWTEEEHQLFLMGLNKYGKGDWRSISRYYVITKTPTQVASHAQKYFRRQNSTTPPDRRRPSIHDIQTVNPTFISMSQSNIPCNEELLPFPHPYGLNPMFNNSYNGGFGGYGDFANDQSSMFSSMNSTFPVVTNPMMNQPSDAYPTSSYLMPSLRNNQWG